MLIKPTPALEILRSAGVVKTKSADEKNQLKEILCDSGLSIEEVISELSNVVKGSGDENTRLRGIDTALKLHGAMKEEDRSVPQIIINIQAPHSLNDTYQDEIPSILIPRALPGHIDLVER